MPTIPELYAKRTDLLEELSEICIEEADCAKRKAETLRKIHDVEAQLARLEDKVIEE